MKQLYTIALLLVMATSFTTAQKRTVRKKISLTETTFYIRNVAAGRYLDLPGYASDAQKGNGSKVQLWDLDDGSDRKFKLESAGNGFYFIKPQHCNSRLDVEGCWPDKWFCKHYKNAKGAPIQIWAFDRNDVGQWGLQQIKKGQFIIVNKYSGKALDADGNRIHDNGCKVNQWDIHKGNNQLWELISVKTGQRYEE